MKIQFTEAAVHALATNFNGEMIEHFFEVRDHINVTEALLRAAAGNLENGHYVMRSLLNILSSEVILTADLVGAVEENENKREEIIMLLLKNEKIRIGEGSVEAIAKEFDSKIVKLLLGRRGDEVMITEEVLTIVAKSFDPEVMALLLDRRNDDVKITEEVVKAAAGNFGGGKGVMALLLDRRGDDVNITEGMVAVIAKLFDAEVMALLLDRRGDDVKITEEVVKATAAG